MNYVLEHYNTEVLESNVPNIAAIYDNSFESTISLPTGEDYIYFKIPSDELQFFAFHNIFGEKIVVEAYDKNDSLVDSKTEYIFESWAKTCKDVLLRKKLFVKNSALVEFNEKGNFGGYSKIYIYPSMGEAFLGGFASGLPVHLGFLEWGWTEGMDAPTLPVIDQENQLLSDSYLVTYEKSAEINITSLDGAKSKNFIQGTLDRISSKHLEEIIVGYDDTTNDPIIEKKWVNRKVTFIEPIHTKDVMWAGVESYKFIMKNSVVTDLNIRLKGFKR